MKVVSVLLGAVAVAGVGSKPTFAKFVHLYFSNIYIYIYIYIYGCNRFHSVLQWNIYVYIYKKKKKNEIDSGKNKSNEKET